MDFVVGASLLTFFQIRSIEAVRTRGTISAKERDRIVQAMYEDAQLRVYSVSPKGCGAPAEPVQPPLWP